MCATTRWKDNTEATLDNVINKLEDPIPDDDRNKSIYWRNILCRPVLSEKKQTMTVNGQEVEFAAFIYRYDQVTSQDNPIDDRVVPKSGIVIAYQMADSVFYIIDMNYYASKFLRKILAYTGRGEIVKNNFDLPDDFFVWLVHRVYSEQGTLVNSIPDNEKILVLEEIKGIRGNIEEEQTKVTASGESVMNIISTLSILLESRKLDQLVIYFRYTDHERIGIKLQSSTVAYVKPYIGIYLENVSSNEETLSKLYMLLYLEVIPFLEQEYRIDLEEKWDSKAHVKFLKELRKSIIDKIDHKIGSLQKNITA